jgi:hypothetical protein
VCLYWSGNNAVLRGWSEPGGLNQLKRLEKVHLHVGRVCYSFALFIVWNKADARAGP